MTEPHDPTAPLPPERRSARPGETPGGQVPPNQPASPGEAPTQYIQPAATPGVQQPATASDPRAQQPAAQHAAAQPAAQPSAPAATTPPPGEPRISGGKYIGGAIAAIIVAGLVGFVVHWVLTDVLNLTVQAVPNYFGVEGENLAYAVFGGLIALAAALVLVLLVFLTPRPRLFFGWIMVLVIIVLVALPFSQAGGDYAAAAVTAALNVLVVGAAWTLLSGVAGRALTDSVA